MGAISAYLSQTGGSMSLKEPDEPSKEKLDSSKFAEDPSKEKLDSSKFAEDPRSDSSDSTHNN